MWRRIIAAMLVAVVILLPLQLNNGKGLSVTSDVGTYTVVDYDPPQPPPPPSTNGTDQPV